MRIQLSRTLPTVAAVFSLLALLALSAQAAPLRDWPVSARGDQGVSIRAIQYLLAARGYRLPADGLFGRATEQALRQFQSAHHLIASNKMNDPTWESLVVPLRQGSKGAAVKAAQVELRNAGYAVIVDGVFGPKMKDAVRKLQARTGHTVDGIIGRQTWYELVGGNDPARESD